MTKVSQGKRPDILTAVLVIAALVVTGLVVRRELFPPSETPTAPLLVPKPVPLWAQYRRPATLLGPANGSVEFIVLSDFQCPFCAAYADTLARYQAAKPGQIRVMFRHAPLSEVHSSARAAAIAAECADRQGRFQAYHDLLFKNHERIDDEVWNVFAEEAGVDDLDAFSRCLTSTDIAQRVDDDRRAATAVGLEGTPSTLVDGTLYPGVLSFAVIDSIVRIAKDSPRTSDQQR